MTKKKEPRFFICDCCGERKPHRNITPPARCAECTLLLSSMHIWRRTDKELEQGLALAQRQVMVFSHMLRTRRAR